MSTLPKAHLLLIDDEPAILRLLQSILEPEGFATQTARRASEARNLLNHLNFDLIVLDLTLPDLDGLTLIPHIRAKSEVPIIVLSSRQEEDEKVTALDLGANDYVTKPFGALEFLARIRASLRSRSGQAIGSQIFESESLRVDLEIRKVWNDGVEQHLSPKEFDLLSLFIAHRGKVLTHKFITQEVWGRSGDSEIQSLRVFIRQLRQKIERRPEAPEFIQTESGIGYRFRV